MLPLSTKVAQLKAMGLDSISKLGVVLGLD